MPRIDLSGALAALYAARMSQPAKRPGATRQAAADRPRADPASAQAGDAPIDGSRDAAIRLAARVGTIGPDDPHGARKAFRMFLETSLLGALGSRVVRDPAFPGLVDEVQRQMESDATIGPLVVDAGRLLIEAVDRTSHDDQRP
jgi:hypothetical protein